MRPARRQPGDREHLGLPGPGESSGAGAVSGDGPPAGASASDSPGLATTSEIGARGDAARSALDRVELASSHAASSSAPVGSSPGLDGHRRPSLEPVGEDGGPPGAGGPGEQAEEPGQAALRRCPSAARMSSDRASRTFSRWASRSSTRRYAARRSTERRRRRRSRAAARERRVEAGSVMGSWGSAGRSRRPLKVARRASTGALSREIPRGARDGGRKYRGQPERGRAADRPAERPADDVDHLVDVLVGLAALGGRPDAALDVVLEDAGSTARRRRRAARPSAGGCRRSTPRARSSGRCRGPGPPSATGGGPGWALSFE